MTDNEERNVEVAPMWLRANESSREAVLRSLEKEEWRPEIERTRPEPSLGDERMWCDAEKREKMLEVKRIVNQFPPEKFEEVRKRSNPHEPLLENKLMVGRYSILLASIDRVTDFLLTGEKIENAVKKRPLDTRPRGDNIDREEELFYFAEAQDLPTPFASQYVWLRKGFYNAKCFTPVFCPTAGITALASHALLDTVKRVPHNAYSVQDANQKHLNVYEPVLREAFSDLVLRGTKGDGVHLFCGFTHNTSPYKDHYGDGPDAANSTDEVREVLFRASYVGQLLYATSIVRAGGKAILHFLDTTTSLSMAVLYLAHVIFDRVSIYKPNMSRPANAEKFLICDGLRSKEARAVRKYLEECLEKVRPDESLLKLIPDGVMEGDEHAINYFIQANDSLIDRQTRFLESYHRMLTDDSRENSHQEKCLETCLPYYLIPYATMDEMKNLYYEQKARGPEEILRVWSGEGVEMEALLSSLSAECPRLDQKAFKQKMDGKARLVVTPCADSVLTLIVATNNGLQFWSGVKREWIELSRLTTTLPPDTVLIGDVIGVTNGRSLIVRILDVAVIFGDDVSSLPLSQRLKAAHKVVEATKKDGARQDVTVTVAKYDTVDQGWRPSLIVDRVVEEEIYFTKRRIRVVQDSGESFYDSCLRGNVWEI